jgi:hypothetical protein
MYFVDENGVFIRRNEGILAIYPLFKSLSAGFCEKIGGISRKSKI